MRKLREQFFVTTPRPGLLEWLTIPVSALGRWLDVLLLEKRKWTSLPWKHRFRAWRYGFSSFTYNLYDLGKNPPDDYIPDVPCLRFGYELKGRYTDTLFSKVAFARIIKSLIKETRRKRKETRRKRDTHDFLERKETRHP